MSTHKGIGKIHQHNHTQNLEPEDSPFGHLSIINAESDEIKCYLNEKPRISLEEDPLLWWKANQSQLPVLSRMARIFLAIPATSTPSERVFSEAGNLITEKRARLSGDSIQAGMCLRSWKRESLLNIGSLGNAVIEIE
jgi:hypothetical protein